jgi:hypothetical protein
VMPPEIKLFPARLAGKRMDHYTRFSPEGEVRLSFGKNPQPSGQNFSPDR